MRRLLMGLFLLVFIHPALADDKLSQDEIRALREAGTIRPLEEILAASKTIRPGRVMEVELEKRHGKLVYEIVVADDAGVVWELKFNAADAKLISQEQDD